MSEQYQKQATERQQQWFEEAVKSLQDVPISGIQTPAYREVHLTEFTKDDLIRIIVELRETSEVYRREMLSTQRRQR